MNGMILIFNSSWMHAFFFHLLNKLVCLFTKYLSKVASLKWVLIRLKSIRTLVYTLKL